MASGPGSGGAEGESFSEMQTRMSSAIARLQQQGESALAALAGQLAPIEGVPPQDVAAALQQLAEAANAANA